MDEEDLVYIFKTKAYEFVGNEFGEDRYVISSDAVILFEDVSIKEMNIEKLQKFEGTLFELYDIEVKIYMKRKVEQ